MDAVSLIAGLVISGIRTIHSHITLSSHVRISLLSLLTTRIYAFVLAFISLYSILESDLYPYMNILLLFNAFTLCFIQFQVSQFLFTLLCTLSWYGVLEIALTTIAQQNIHLPLILSAIALGITPVLKSLIGNTWQLQSAYLWLLGFHILASFFWFVHFPLCANDPDNHVCMRYRWSDTLSPWGVYFSQVGLLLFAACMQSLCFYFITYTSVGRPLFLLAHTNNIPNEITESSLFVQFKQEIQLIRMSVLQIIEQSMSFWHTSLNRASNTVECMHTSVPDTTSSDSQSKSALVSVLASALAGRSKSSAECVYSCSITEEEAFLLVQRGLLLSKTRRAI